MRDVERRAGQVTSQLIIAYLVFIAVGASNAPSPLYVTYQRMWHLSSLVLTAVFGVYAVGVLAALLLIGPISDQRGRKPVIAVATGLLVAATLLFLFATNVGWLFAARLVQGVATGSMIGAAAAWLVELGPAGHVRRASLLMTVPFTMGAACLPLFTGFLAEYAASPTVLPFLVLLGLEAIGALLLVYVPESRSPGQNLPGRLRVERPSVPRPIRPAFVVAGASVGLAWAVGSLYAALSGTIESQFLHVQSYVYTGVLLFCYNGLAGVGQLGLRRLSNRAAMLMGVAGVTAGMGLVQLSLVLGDTRPFFAGVVLSGIGSGAAFMGAMALVNSLAPPEHRASVVSAFNILAYVAVAVPVVGVGLLASPFGLEGATGLFFLVIVISAIPLFIGISKRTAPACADDACAGDAGLQTLDRGRVTPGSLAK
ncbi:MAG TPA: MFS transporter [Acidimicrobiales bacterium]|nr:MFS transporter [Acidimicrobiales bacterium]